MKLVSIDIETTGLCPFKDDIVLIQLYDGVNFTLVDMSNPNKIDLAYIKWVLEHDSITKLGANIKFDIKFLKHKLGINTINVFDVMLADNVLWNGLYESYSLESIYNRYFERYGVATLFDLGLDKSINKTFKLGELTYLQIAYAKKDVEILFPIYEKQIKLIDQYDLWYTIDLENRFTVLLADIELTGMYLDPDIWLDITSQNKELQDSLENKLKEYADINWNSSQQVLTIFRDKYKVVDKHGKETVNKDVLKRNAKDELLQTYLEYKEAKKQVSTYGLKFLSKLIDGRIHSEYYQLQATSRMSSSDVNMQNIPKRNRKAFTGEYSIVDFSNMEMRRAADLSQDPALITFFETGDGDSHSHTARLMFGNVTESNRAVAKRLNFSILYGAGEANLMEVFQVDKSTAQSWIKLFKKAYPRLDQWMEEVRKQALIDGFIEIDPITKRRFYFKEHGEYLAIKKWLNYHTLAGNINSIDPKVVKRLKSRYYTLKGEIERKSVNYIVQGSCASMTKLACLELAKNGYTIYNIVHDEIILSRGDIDQIKEILRNVGRIFNKRLIMESTAINQNYWTH